MWGWQVSKRHWCVVLVKSPAARSSDRGCGCGRGRGRGRGAMGEIIAVVQRATTVGDSGGGTVC